MTGFDTVVDWLNENGLRAYPLTNESLRQFSSFTLDNILLDAQFVDRTGALAADEQLLSIQCDPVNIVFFTTSDFFEVPRSSVFPLAVRTSKFNLLVVGEAVKNLPGTASFSFSNVFFEPATIFEFANAWKGVTSLTISDTRIPANTGTFGVDDIIYFNKGIQLDFTTTEDTISMFAGNNYGYAIGCQDYSGLELVKDCSEFVFSINGSRPSQNKITLEAGSNINIFEDPDNHTIYISYPYLPEDICGGLVKPQNKSIVV